MSDASRLLVEFLLERYELYAHKNVLPRTGYIITCCRCPNHWVSKLQSEIALSSMESEYNTLSMAAYELLPIWCLLIELSQHINLHVPLSEKFNTTHTTHLAPYQIFEDDQACTALGTQNHNKIWTKHIAIKWHHFKDQIKHGLKWIVPLTGQISKQNLKCIKSMKHYNYS
jgi:hypothetical protein